MTHFCICGLWGFVGYNTFVYVWSSGFVGFVKFIVYVCSVRTGVMVRIFRGVSRGLSYWN